MVMFFQRTLCLQYSCTLLSTSTQRKFYDIFFFVKLIINSHKWILQLKIKMGDSYRCKKAYEALNFANNKFLLAKIGTAHLGISE